jgi:hypothetical protein
MALDGVNTCPTLRASILSAVRRWASSRAEKSWMETGRRFKEEIYGFRTEGAIKSHRKSLKGY